MQMMDRHYSLARAALLTISLADWCALTPPVCLMRCLRYPELAPRRLDAGSSCVSDPIPLAVLGFYQLVLLCAPLEAWVDIQLTVRLKGSTCMVSGHLLMEARR